MYVVLSQRCMDIVAVCLWQIYIFLGHIWITTAGGFLVAMFVQYPFSIGLERAINCHTKRDVLLAGRSHLTYEKEKQKLQ